MKKVLLVGLVAMLAFAVQSDAKLYLIKASGDASLQYLSIGGVPYIVKQNVTTAVLSTEAYRFANFLGFFPWPIMSSRCVLAYDAYMTTIGLYVKDNSTPGYLKGDWIMDVAFVDQPWDYGAGLQFFYSDIMAQAPEIKYDRMVVQFANAAMMLINNGFADYPSATRFNSHFSDGTDGPGWMNGFGPLYGRQDAVTALTWGTIIPLYEPATFKMTKSVVSGDWWPATSLQWFGTGAFGIGTVTISTGSELKP